MNVVFEGLLSKPWNTQDILRAISSLKEIRYGILRISVPEENIQGRIVFADEGHIVDASISGPTESRSAYESFRQLLSLSSGSYVFLDSGMTRPAEFTESLYIPVEKVIALLPALPENPSELFDEKSLLDKVFGTIRNEAKSFQTVETVSNQPYAQRWVEPLFDNPIPASAKTSDQPEPLEDPDEQRQSMTRLRGLPANPSIFNILRQRASIFFSAVLFFSVITTAI